MKTLMIFLTLFSAGAFADQTDQFVVSQQSVKQIIELNGVVEAVNKGTLAAQTSGTIVGVYVDANDYVEKDTVILEISATQQTASVDSAIAQLVSAQAQQKEAEAQLKRFIQLYPKGAISKEQMDSAQARARTTIAAVSAANAAVAQAKESLGYTSIRAPFAGIVLERLVELGETVTPGMPVVSGFSLEALRVVTDIPQRYQPLIKNVEQFNVVANSGERFTPTDLSLFSYADARSHTFKIRLSLPENTDNIFPGMWLKTEFHYGDSQRLMVPKSAVIERGDLNAVYRIVNGKRVLNPIRIGQEYEQGIEVLSGLEIGDTLSLHAVHNYDAPSNGGSHE